MALFEALKDTVMAPNIGGKVMDATEAVKLVKDGDTVTASGIGANLIPEKVLSALEVRFLTDGSPRNLTLFYPLMFGAGPGNGMEHFAHSGLLRRVIGANFYNELYPEMAKLILENKIEAYCFPLGTLLHLMRETAQGKPGFMSKVALGTFVDPRVEGGKFNAVTKEDLVQLVNVCGEEYLYYRAIPVDVAIIRGTTADEDGNISMEEEPLSLAMQVLAMVARNSGGKVIAQVKRLAARGSIPPRLVEVPGFLVDAIVVDESQKQLETMDRYDPGLSGEIRVPPSPVVTLPMDYDKILCRRAAMELQSGWMINMGAFVPIQKLTVLLREENVADLLTISVEHGALGGINEGSHMHRNPTAFIESDRLMDFYVGGGLNACFLGLGEVDGEGNVNLSKFGDMYTGPGGSIEISHRTPRVYFCGAFRRSGLEVKGDDGRLTIVREGAAPKFVAKVEQITIHGKNRLRNGQQVFYVTERGVFRLEERGLVLIEIAPGIDLQRDILDLAACPIHVSPNLKEMDRRIFVDAPMSLRKIVLEEKRQALDVRQAVRV